MTQRCCLACGHAYRGPLACPKCGEPGEPMREHRGGSRKGHPNVGGPRRNAGRPRLPRLTADEAKALLRELAPDARTPAEVARALGCRPERVREALRGGCTVATAERWRRTRPAPAVDDEGPRCHDCADHDGTCPMDGSRCDPRESYGASVEAFGVADALSTHPHLGLEEG